VVTTKIPLAIVKPPKPISKMTDAERRAFADRIFDAMAEAFIATSSTARAPQ
jgi:hypothetical protein